MMATITWLLINFFTTFTPDMGSAPHVAYSDVVQCGAFAVINNYPMDGLATISNSMILLKNLNYNQTHQIIPILNGFHSSVLMIGDMDIDCMVYLLMHLLN